MTTTQFIHRLELTSGYLNINGSETLKQVQGDIAYGSETLRNTSGTFGAHGSEPAMNTCHYCHSEFISESRIFNMLRFVEILKQYPESFRDTWFRACPEFISGMTL